ncbi:hypothetical protein E4U14_000956, partial [Claviceps sp. LM454 group G7]
MLLTTALRKQGRYAYVLDSFLSNRSLTIPEKLRALEEKEAQLLVSYGSKEHANAAQRQKRPEPYRHPHHRARRHSDNSDEGKEHARNLRMAAEGKLYKKSKGKSHRSRKDAKPSSRRRKHGHSAACESDSSYTQSDSEDSGSDNDGDRTERVMLSKENIRKSTPETWALDTGA